MRGEPCDKLIKGGPMKRGPMQGLTGLILILALVSSARGQILSPLDYLPASTPDGKWKKHGRMDTYSGDDLFIYINGGAEIFHEYGFRQVMVQDYVHSMGNTLTLELYEMEDSAAAFGMYSFKRGESGEPVAVGSGGRQEGYYLHFWKGPYLVTLTGFDEDAVTVSGVRDVAFSVSAGMASLPEGGVPPLVALLPEKGLITQTVCYLEGHLGLYNVYPFSNRDIFKTTRAVIGTYEDGYRLFLIGAVGDGLSLLDAAAETFRKEIRYTEVTRKAEGWLLSDSEGRVVHLRCLESIIVAVVGNPGITGLESVFSSLKRDLPAGRK